MDWLGGLIGGLGSIASGIIGNNANLKAMKHGIQWRVADAKAAGIHPLAALGAQVQPVPSQPLLGDAAISGISEAVKGLTKSPEQQRQERANARLTEAQADLAEAQSRTMALRARQPPGSTTGGNVHGVDRNPPVIRQGGIGIQRNPLHYSEAQQVQNEYGDMVESMVGVPSYLDSWLNRSRLWETDSHRDRRLVAEFRRYRELGGRLPANEWMRRHGF